MDLSSSQPFLPWLPVASVPFAVDARDLPGEHAPPWIQNKSSLRWRERPSAGRSSDFPQISMVANGFLMGFNRFLMGFNGFLMEWNGIIIHSMGDTLWQTNSLRTGSHGP